MVVEVLPRDQWRGRSRSLPTGNNASHDDRKEDKITILPTGRVVAVINRNNRDIVATFPVRERKN